MNLLAVALGSPPRPRRAAHRLESQHPQEGSRGRLGRRHRAELVSLADQVWAFAETALRETRSATMLADYAEQQGFQVERGVAGMPTAFVASYGEGRPIIGILGEYDALPGLSQKAVPRAGRPCTRARPATAAATTCSARPASAPRWRSRS